jgi:hypothetical protein
VLSGHTLLMVLYVGGLPLAMAGLLDALGRSRLPALLAFPLAYNLPLQYGFVGFAFSLPVLLWLLAQVVRLLLQESPIRWRWLGTAAIAFLLYLCHLQNFLYGLCAAAAFALFAAVPWRRRLLAMATFAPAVLGMVWWQRNAHPDTWHRPRGLKYAWWALRMRRQHDLPGGPHPWLTDLGRRLLAIPDHALRGFTDNTHVPAAKMVQLLVVVCFVLGLVGRLAVPGPVPQQQRMRTSSWVAFLGVVLAYCLLPHHLNEFDIVTFFPRFAPLLILMALPLIPAGLRRYRGWLSVLVAAPLVAFSARWGLAVGDHYRAYAAETAELRAVLEAAKPGHRLDGLMFERNSRTMRVEAAMLAAANYYVLLHPAPGSMVPLQYCGMLHIPCTLTPKFDTIPDPSPWAPDAVKYDQEVKFFDYFLVRSPGGKHDPFAKQKGAVELVTKRGPWALWKRKGVE